MFARTPPCRYRGDHLGCQGAPRSTFPRTCCTGAIPSFVGRQHRSRSRAQFRAPTARLPPTTSHRGRGTRGRRGTRTVRPGIQGQGPTAGDRQGARPEGQRPDEEVRHHRADPGDDRRRRRARSTSAADQRRRVAARGERQRTNGDDASHDAAPTAVVEIADVELPLEPVVDPPAAPTDRRRPVLGEDGEPLAEWELALRESGDDRGRRRRPTDDAVGGRQRRPRRALRAERRPAAPPQRPPEPAAGRPGRSASRGGPAGRRPGRRREPQPPPPSPPQGRVRPRRRRPAGRRRRSRRSADVPVQQPASEIVEVVGLPRHARRGLRLPPREGLPAEPRRRLHPGQAGPPVRPAQGRPRHRHEPAGGAQREEPGAARRSTPSTAATPRRPAGGPGSRTSRRCSPTSGCASRTRRTRRT